MYTTVRGIDMDEANIEQVIKEILAIDANDGIIFRYEKIEPIREDDDYNNFRVHFNAFLSYIPEQDYCLQRECQQC